MKLLDLSILATQKAGKFLNKKFREEIDPEKNWKESLRIITEEILKYYPEHSFFHEAINEESKENVFDSEFIWIIEPISGFLNYSRKNPLYAASVSVFKSKKKEKSKNFNYLEGELLAGAINIPELRELYFGGKNYGTFLNGKICNVSKNANLENSIFSTTQTEGILLKNLNLKNKNQVYGSSTISLAFLAAGRLDAYFGSNLKPWEIACGSLLAFEAGGQISDFHGNNIDLFSQDFLCTNKKLHKKLIENS